MNEVSLDCETTTFQKGNPFSRRNRLCCVGIANGDSYRDFDIEYTNSPYGSYLQDIKATLEQADLLIGFNIKFDLHWLRRYINGLDFVPVWDCQLAHFILNGQGVPYPSLNDALLSNGLESKLDLVSSQFWSLGIDTTEIPWDILSSYLKQDVLQTKALKDIQYERFAKGDPRLYQTFRMQCDDLLVLEEAEFLGMRLDVETATALATAIDKKLAGIRAELSDFATEEFNWSSSDHVSVYLFGGVLPTRVREATSRVLKDGTIKEGTRWGTKYIEFPRLVKPLERSESPATRELSDEQLRDVNEKQLSLGRRPVQRIYSVDESNLQAIKCSGGVKKVIELLLKHSELKKLYSTYYKGLPDKITEMDWPEGEIHGSFNQCVVPTGRLSSSKPNLQNLAAETKPLYVSRYT